ncbi:carbohydrate ABC transporter permease [Nocardiopsis algeriensis]|uniref:sn-glycerol 3-phosphate transport system permease protein n=1 Tax=Nocardiopsis algeriensis TaxID=1478215 RepID=A0A841INL1_9ACTN|nr:carbohydrate ABC transporter permease [Nocardiopsis algeriensis]MBB6120327.1 sn-glycerol 3-phosphate transport system permease protein [Nocardiopsis algeriensis]
MSTTAEAPRRRIRPGQVLGRAGAHLLLALLLVPVLFPVYYAFAGALMAPHELSRFPAQLVPTGLHTDNIRGALEAVPLVRMYANSLTMAGVITAAQLMTSALAAYAFVFLRFRGSAVVFALFLSTLMVPGEATFIPNYLTISAWGLADTFAGLVLPFLAYAFGTFLLRQSFRQFPRELYDAARMDGMGHLRFLWTILLPLSRPSLLAVGVYVFITSWNMYFWPLIITRSTEMQTLQIGLNSLKTGESTDPGLLLAGAALSVLPTLALVILGQRFIVRGLTAGAVK